MKKSGSLLQKLIITFIVILTIVLVSLAWLLSIWFRITYFTEKKVQFQKDGEYISESIKTYNSNKNSLEYDKLQAIVDMSSVGANADITVSDKFDNIYIYSKTSSTKEIDNKPENLDNSKYSLLDGKPVEYIGDRYTYIYPILEDDEFQGYIVMTAPLSTIGKQLHRIYLIVWISALGAMVFASVVLSLVSKKILINPLAEINKAAKRFANGEVNKRVHIESCDEIGELASSFNIMAESLEKVENNRRDFISNVSHELRSPITSIKGFIAGIIDGVIPRDKEGYYLDIVYSEIKRLTRLINDLLDLSAIESGKLKFNIRKIDINELIRLCVINNEQKIREKQIMLKIDLKDQNCYVKADEDKTMQVITNLLDNAIKYCGNNGIIRISTYSKGSKVFVEIYNNGPKIADEEIRHIWNRFYKSDKSRTNKVSTGLGLPIVRMIIMQQGEEVWVKNHPNIGVTFTFSLTKYKNNKIR
ncbi:MULTISPECIES: sensor histidine kinase [Clostridium]|jgi:Signal transduction histidine kinase|uniref:histidine kinase n=2 Tax=Clostridium beijerinckii TaxID=1520 RepID=A0A0B5QFQ3_CLOBE|nr:MULTISPECIES: HAMP domain-containing sensor histidine kinase [Clostridium]ABR32274.1 integral membrane sensor signal transduction histidine kinase [Clostridium beijerinckii NCIMB 8052]AIU01875.1 integral membrane sensor signal transduction histidine kinase [Clostridium beijerinckii ATCC 35702]AJG96797.1 histidine kinase [Clostridium beijerinckii]ALB48527.1 sensor histidine kinase [Clostridium beijerinckii NRRL B-598]AQS02738.1 signal transduction histidine-protein kinase BaeS [Clostridium b